MSNVAQRDLNVVQLAFSAHRLETIPFYEKAWEASDFIILEEPPHPLFKRMLAGEVKTEVYLKSVESSFPAFSLASCKLLQQFYSKGKQIEQIDPYLEKLIKIYQLIEEKKTPQDIKQTPGLTEVYEAEHLASGRLISYYQAVLGEFDQAVAAVKEFAKADAKRIALRDKMRAQSVTEYLDNKDGHVFIETGYIHLFLSYYLCQILPRKWRVRAHFLLVTPARKLAKEILGRPLPYPLVPGDMLTLWYIGKRKTNRKWEDLFAARALIYNKLISTEELHPTDNVPYPHLTEEFKIKVMLRQFDYNECARLFNIIKWLPREKAWEVLKRYGHVNPN